MYRYKKHACQIKAFVMLSLHLRTQGRTVLYLAAGVKFLKFVEKSAIKSQLPPLTSCVPLLQIYELCHCFIDIDYAHIFA